MDWTAFEGYPDLTVRTRGAEDGLPISPLLAAFQLGTNPIIGGPSVPFPASKAGIHNLPCVRTSPGASISISHVILYPADVCSAMRGEVEFARMLLELGAGIGVIDDNDYTALHWAVIMDNIQFMRLLQKHGADVSNTRDKRLGGRTPAQSTWQKEIVQLLSEYGEVPSLCLHRIRVIVHVQ